MLWFSFTLIWYFPLFYIHYHITIHQNKRKYQIIPRVKLNHSSCTLENFFKYNIFVATTCTCEVHLFIAF